jgi:hypothetical protein
MPLPRIGTANSPESELAEVHVLEFFGDGLLTVERLFHPPRPYRRAA